MAKWEDLDPDCLTKVFERAGLEALMNNVALVCKSWYKASLDPQCWKVLDFEYTQAWRSPGAAIQFRSLPLPRLIKFAVNRSQGTATTIVLPIHNWNWDFEDTISSISQGCPALKKLILPHMLYNTEGEFISKLINRWKDLEFLSLSCQYPYKEVLTEIRDHCKKFVGLTTRGRIGSEDVLAIITLLPSIKYLKLSGSDLARENLVLILSKCRELELLDVTNCVGFDAGDAEISKMASHIKTFRSEGSVAGGLHEYPIM